MRTDDDRLLDPFFRAAQAAPEPGHDMQARLLAAAEAQLAAPAVAARPQRRRHRLAAVLLAALGGWPAMAGMATAAATGVWLGFSSPDLVEGYLGSSESYSLGDYMPDVVEIAGGP